MRVGLALILVGHVNLLLGAVLHGTVLRHVANPRGAVTPEYTAANVISVGSGLLVSAAGGPGCGRRMERIPGLTRALCLPECFLGPCGPRGVQESPSTATGEGSLWSCNEGSLSQGNRGRLSFIFKWGGGDPTREAQVSMVSGSMGHSRLLT